MKLSSLLKAASMGVILLAGSLYAIPNQVVIKSTAYNGTPDGSAGEFKAITTNNGTFLTFCMEESIRVSRGVSYTYTIDSNVLSGGANLGHAGDMGSGDPISQGSALLFYMFAHGTLFDAANPMASYFGANRDTNAGILQQALWILEDEQAYNAANPYVAYVQSVFAGNAQDAYTGTFVKAMNLWGADRKDVQSMLILVPDAASSVALLGLGLLSLAAIRRKF